MKRQFYHCRSDKNLPWKGEKQGETRELGADKYCNSYLLLHNKSPQSLMT